MTAFRVLRKTNPVHQIEAAELRVAMNRYTFGYARSLLAATPPSQLVQPEKPKAIRGVLPEQIAMMERESASRERELRLVERT